MKKIILLISAITLIIIFGVVIKIGYFNTHKIECFTQYGPCQEDLVNKAKFLVGRPIYLPLPRKQIAQTFSNISSISEVVAHRRLPSTLVLGIILRRPIAVVLGISQQRVVVDERGVVFDSKDRSALPVLYIDGNVEIGTTLEGQQLTAAKLVNQVGSIIQTPVSARLQGKSLLIASNNGVEIVLDTEHVADNWDTSLQSIWARSKIDGKLMQKIDLRFSQPAVTF